MAGRAVCCRYEPTLGELLEDEIMAPVLRSAGFDPQGFRDMMAETARRVVAPHPNLSPAGRRVMEDGRRADHRAARDDDCGDR